MNKLITGFAVVVIVASSLWITALLLAPHRPAPPAQVAAQPALLPATIALLPDLAIVPSSLAWREYPDAPRTDRTVYWEIIRGGDRRNEVGHVVALYYADATQRSAAFQAITTPLGTGETVPDIGEQSYQVRATTDWPMHELVLLRCDVIVHISIPLPLQGVHDAGIEIDRYIQEHICRP
jgi:hypothetical protein